jgi:hypothetical protein
MNAYFAGPTVSDESLRIAGKNVETDIRDINDVWRLGVWLHRKPAEHYDLRDPTPRLEAIKACEI